MDETLIYTCESGKWIVRSEFGPGGITVSVTDADTGWEAASLTPEELGSKVWDIPILSWSHGAETLAVANLKQLWIWDGERPFFWSTGNWHWRRQGYALQGISWSPDDKWILRTLSDDPPDGKRLWRFECFELSSRRIYPAKVTYPEITVAEWLDDEEAFAVNVIEDESQREYRTVHIDARSGEVLREFG